MYLDKGRGRVLMKDGTTVVSSVGYTKMILEGKDTTGIKVASDRHSELYDSINNTDISVELEDVHPTPDNQHTPEEYEELIDKVMTSSRFVEDGKYIDRLSQELDFFERTYNVKFLLKVIEVIEKFKQDNVLWGVGRGSSCASLVAYVLYINDIDPIKYNIPFKELSKEEEY